MRSSFCKSFAIMFVLFATPLQGDEASLHFLAEGDTSVTFGGTDFGSALMKTGDIGGVLRDTEIHADGSASASASYRATGKG